jgi:hypothetical protein
MRKKCDISSGPRSGGLTKMMIDPNASESNTKMLTRPPGRQHFFPHTLIPCCEATHFAFAKPVSLLVRRQLVQGGTVKKRIAMQQRDNSRLVFSRQQKLS